MSLEAQEYQVVAGAAKVGRPAEASLVAVDPSVSAAEESVVSAVVVVDVDHWPSKRRKPTSQRNCA